MFTQIGMTCTQTMGSVITGRSSRLKFAIDITAALRRPIIGPIVALLRPLHNPISAHRVPACIGLNASGKMKKGKGDQAKTNFKSHCYGFD
jgi:hypothetical protein